MYRYNREQRRAMTRRTMLSVPVARRGSVSIFLANRSGASLGGDRSGIRTVAVGASANSTSAVIAERVHRGVASPPERLAVAALDEMPDEDDTAAVRAWAPSAAFRDAVRSVVLATLALYLGIVESLADEADREDADDGGETMH